MRYTGIYRYIKHVPGYINYNNHTRNVKHHYSMDSMYYIHDMCSHQPGYLCDTWSNPHPYILCNTGSDR